ncbi:MAG: hypothetical protein JRN68_07935 [Nitrososphaerota archaeon]|nr:hypothetical protein [Nitrososphaerota archaeon]
MRNRWSIMKQKERQLEKVREIAALRENRISITWRMWRLGEVIVVIR